jgi:hypothetical protein
MFFNRQKSPPRSGIASHTALASLGTARALSSHARHIFRKKYEGRHRFAKTVFVFDAALIAAVVALIVLVISLWVRPVRPPSLALAFDAPPLVAGIPVALEARIRSADGAAHHNVRLQWRLPPGAEIIRSQPKLNADNSVFFGDIPTGQEAASLLVVRLFQPEGSEASFGFSLRSRDGIAEQTLTGLERRTVTRSSLIANVVPEFKADVVAPEGVVIPIEVMNPTDLPLPFVQIDVVGPKQDQAGSWSLHTLQPHETRFVFIPLGSVSGQASLSWVVLSEAREMSRGSWQAAVRPLDFPLVRGPLVSKPDEPTPVNIGLEKEAAGTDLSMVAVQPLLEQPVQIFSLSETAASGSTSVTVRIPPFHHTTGTSHEFLVAFTRTAANGSRELGPGVTGSVRISFPFSTQVRYTSSAGDQLGAGPHPPRAGFETRYWVFWEAGPVGEKIRDMSVHAELPPGVRTTGNVSAADGGTWSLDARNVTWNLPSLGSAGGSGSDPKAVFGFEVLVKPDIGDVGRTMTIVGTSTASATDPQTGMSYQSEDGQKSSNLPEDRGKPGSGIVLPL